MDTAKAIAKDATYKAAAKAEEKLDKWEQQETSSSKKKAYHLAKKGATLVKSRVAPDRETDTEAVRDKEQEVRSQQHGQVALSGLIWSHLVWSAGHLQLLSFCM